MKTPAQHCILMNLTICEWAANKQDSAVAQEVAQAKGVEDIKMGRYWKSLLPKCAEVDLVRQTLNKARAFHYRNTLSYLHDGPRILPMGHYEYYQDGMKLIQAEFGIALANMIAQYDDLRLSAKRLMGSLYNEMDYPDRNYVRSRYSITPKILPLPVATTLLELGFDAAVAADMKAQLEAELNDRFRQNARALWEQLGKNLEKLLATLSNPKKAITNESLDVTRRMAELLPKLNVVEDHRLDAVCHRLTEVLMGLTHAVLGTDLVRRNKVSTDLLLLRDTIRTSMTTSSSVADEPVEVMAEELTRAAA